MASQNPPVRGVEFTLDFTLFKNDGSVIANPGTFTKKISKDEGAVADIAGGVTKEDTTYGQCSLVLSPTEMDADRVWLLIKDDTGGCIPLVLVIHTAPAQQSGDAFARLGAPAGATVVADIAALDGGIEGIGADTTEMLTRLPDAVAGSVGGMAVVGSPMTLTPEYDVTAADVAAAVLATPDNKLATDSEGRVTTGDSATPVGHVRITSQALGELLPGTLVYAYLATDTSLASPVSDPVVTAANGTWHLDLPADDTYTLVARLAGKTTVTEEVTT